MANASLRPRLISPLSLFWIPLTLWCGIAVVTDCAKTWVIPGCSIRNDSSSTLLATAPVPSLMVCAARAKVSNATMFTLENEICTLYNVHNGTSSEASMFVRKISPDLLEEVARGRSTYANTSYNRYTKEKAVDGNNSTFYASSGNDYQPFWIVDLGEIRDVYEVRILPYISGSYFDNIEIRIGKDLLTTGNFSSHVLLATYQGPYSWNLQYLYCNSGGIPGRYLSVQRMLPNSTILIIRELEVYAMKKP